MSDASMPDADLDAVPRRRTALVASAVVGVVMLAFVGLLATRDTGPREARSPLIGNPAPAVVGETMDGDTFDLEELRGRWVLVNFFATWCPPCIVEHPELVAFQDSATEIQAFFEEQGGEWPVLPEGLSGAAVSWGVHALPESFLVSPQGIVVHKFTGGVTVEGLESVLAQARGLPPPDRSGESG